MSTVKTVQIESSSPQETIQLGTLIGMCARAGDVVLFSGELGAGKTTMSQGIASGLEFTGTVTSPTFTLIQEYDGRIPVYHIDAYRLETEEEVADLGLEELFEGDGLTLVEWSERLGGLIPRDYVTVDLISTGDGSRLITLGYEGVYGARFFSRVITELGERNEVAGH